MSRQAPTGQSYPPRHRRTWRRSRAPAPCRAVLLLGNQLRRVSMPAASGASPPATPPAAASGMCGGAPCCVAAAGSDVAAAGAGPGSVAARAKKWSAARAAQRTGASSRCGAQYGEFAHLMRFYLSRLGCVGSRQSLFYRCVSCFSSKRPNSAAMTDVGGASAARGFRFGASRKFFLKGARETVSDPKREFSECRI